MQERLFMTARLSRLAVPSGDLPVEVIEEALLPELGVVMASAYAGTTDDEGGSDSEALAELNNASRDEYGEPIRNCWLAARVDIVLAGAVICTRFENRPFIAFVFTDHAFTRRGIARQLILEIGGRLRTAGEREVTLWVTASNPAARIYESLGFDVERSVTA
jgi:GNAT superfamily N-acetyltransferase